MSEKGDAMSHLLWTVVTSAIMDDDSQRGVKDRVLACYVELAPMLFHSLTKEFQSGEDAEDALQEAFLRLYQAWSRREHIDNPKQWLIAVGRHVILDRRKRQGRREKREPELTYELIRGAAQPAPEAALLEQERQQLRSRAVSAALDELTPVQRLILSGRLGGLMLREVADAEWNTEVKDVRRVWEIQEQAIRRVQRYLRDHGVQL